MMRIASWSVLSVTIASFGCGACGAHQDPETRSNDTPPETVSNDTPPPETQEPPCEESWPRSLEGAWTLYWYEGQDAVGPNGERPIGMAANYTFEGGRFRMEGYPPITSEGSYAIAEEDGARIRVRFTNVRVQGEARPDYEEWITFRVCNAEIEFARKRFRRGS